ncbi:uncharacterized protein LOC122892510 isoform X2 [Neovison vison]|uniref:uncharacterized protein LOC122892510 isoform X2 n=1 Tax=Neovison vison TaxID=452646 RepID=UPI001CF01A7D|nr:uncharacterized protein LOC122892510 isoform X2 [Neogale vison]
MLRGAAQPSRPCPHPRAPRPWEGRRRGSPAPTQKVLGTRGSDLPRRHSEHHRGCAGRLVGPWAGLPTHHVCTPRKHGRLPRAGSRCSPLPLCASGRLRGAVSTAGARGASGTPREGLLLHLGADTPRPERCVHRPARRSQHPLRGDHWLGLDHISSLTSQPGLRSELRVDLLDADNRTLQAHYDDFRVGREEQFYPLTLGRYSGNAGDAFRGLGLTDNQEGCGFSTLDRDHDRCSPCVDGAQTFSSCSHAGSGAGWWYSACGRADLNGLWPEQAGAASGMRWAAGDHQPALRASVLRVHTTASGKV